MFFKERKDTSSETIAEAAALLNRKPKRQGSNQYVIESVFDDDFKKHPDHEQIVNGRGKKTPEEQKYINTYHERLAKIHRERNPEKFAAYDKKEAKRKEELKANPFKSGLPKPQPPEDKWEGKWDAARAASITRNTGP